MYVIHSWQGRRRALLVVYLVAVTVINHFARKLHSFAGYGDVSERARTISHKAVHKLPRRTSVNFEIYHVATTK